MPVEYSGAEIFRDALYSWETWGTGIKYFLIFFVAGLVLLGLMALLKALARFIKRILR
jgi:hypothetical protein